MNHWEILRLGSGCTNDFWDCRERHLPDVYLGVNFILYGVGQLGILVLDEKLNCFYFQGANFIKTK